MKNFDTKNDIKIILIYRNIFLKISPFKGSKKKSIFYIF